METPLENLPSFGPTSSAWLREIGVHAVADLRELGPVLAYYLVKKKQPRASLNLLWAMAAAVSGKEITELTADEKVNLRAALKELK